MKTAAGLFALLLVCVSWRQAAFADDLDVIADSKTTPAQRGEAYERLTHADFSAISVKLAKILNESDRKFGIGPKTKEPWNEINLREDGRIYFTLGQLWGYHMQAAKTKPHYTALLLSIMENPEYGAMRSTMVFKIDDCLHHWVEPSDASELSKADLLKHLDGLARDPKNPLKLREIAVWILCKYTDPNPYVGVGLAMIGAEENPVDKDMPFRDWMNGETFQKLTKENQHLCIRVGFEWLKEMAAGHPAMGYFHAGHLEGMVNTANGYGAIPLFEPDMRLPRYQPFGEKTRDLLWEDTVKNALDWWDKHHAEYEDEASKPQ